MYLRVPHFRSVNQQIQEQRFKEQMRILVTDPHGRDWIEADIRRQEEETGRTCSDEDRDFLERTLVEGSFTFEIWPEDTMRLLPVAQEWGHDLEGMQWIFLVADDAQFVTSDNPLVMIDTTDPQHAGGLRERTTEVTFPLDRSHALLAVWGDGPPSRYAAASKLRVREINRRAVRAAARFVFSPYSSTPLDHLVQQHVDTAPRPESTTFAIPGPQGLEYLRHTRLVYGSTTPTRENS